MYVEWCVLHATGSTMVEQAANWASKQMQKDENESLKCQLEAYKNEVELLKHEHRYSIDEKDKQMKSLQQALQGMQQVRSHKRNRNMQIIPVELVAPIMLQH